MIRYGLLMAALLLLVAGIPWALFTTSVFASLLACTMILAGWMTLLLLLLLRDAEQTYRRLRRTGVDNVTQPPVG